MKCFHCGHPYKIGDGPCRDCGSSVNDVELELLYYKEEVEALKAEISRLNLILNNSSEKGKPNV
jgi:hypothetical protein